MKYVLALDQGTTSSRAILFNKLGVACEKAQHAVQQIYPKPGWVEHDPMDILNTQLQCVRNLLTVTEAKDIAAIGITNQRETTILWEKATGRPVHNAIVWQCRRTSRRCDKLIESGWGEKISEKTGLVIDAYFSATKIAWLLENVPGLKERAKRGEILFGTVDTWLLWNLTGGEAHITDYSNASRTMLFNIDTLTWDEELLRLFDIPACMLPKPVSGCGILGRIAKGISGLESLAGIPIGGMAGDQAAALFGQCCFKEGQAKNTYGTGCFTLMNVGANHVRSSRGLVTSVAWALNGKVTYALEGSAFNAGAAIQWLRDELGLISTARECDILAESVEDTGGVYFVPAFTGLGAPYWDMYARGVLCGLTRGSTKAHIARATLEAIAYQVTDLVEAMKLDAGKITELRVDGGACVSDVMMQFQADMLGMEVNRPKMTETTAIGAAYLAGLSVGFWKDVEELERIRETQRVFSPNMDSSHRFALYRGWQEAVDKARDS
ncbi:MAG: glycerol kinase GlpK [Clostridia bacterium]|nr:glycerol kinase GlpK [Clostridia bacterium]